MVCACSNEPLTDIVGQYDSDNQKARDLKQIPFIRKSAPLYYSEKIRGTDPLAF